MVWKKLVSLHLCSTVLGLKDIASCEYDLNGYIWINEVTGYKIGQFDVGGKPVQMLGNAEPGFQSETVPFSKAQFNWIYDLRRGPDGNIYVLDSRNFVVRMLDLRNKLVSVVAGTGEGGYTGDGGDALHATFGHNPDAHFDGPWSMSLDEEGNIFVGDTQNHVVRMVERSTNTVSTIAGNPSVTPGKRNDPLETNPLNLNLPLICSMDYNQGRLFVPEWDGDIVVLAKTQ